ncbi:uncharacterized protein LOC143368146 [Andrena cerasifolii]|uniref:uncharacterized protein LOC143368146 n=1 Tax=Andrena cerasifolii TaxID=2819439 RepID=UPI0040375FD6
MRKLFVFLCVALLASSLVVGCKGPGLICSDDKDCCGPLVCNPWAGRCTKPPTPPTTTAAPTTEGPEDPAAPPSDGQP